MNLIPVIDLMQGQVVRAVRGDRHAYRPIDSPLCQSSDPVTVAKILCEHCATQQLYVADLDALLGHPRQSAVLRALLHAMPGTQLWLDAGFANASAAQASRLELGEVGDVGDVGNVEGGSRVIPVFGSESLASRDDLARCFDGGHEDRGVLSLDRRDGQHLDAAGCWNAPALWPRRVIVMTLERVGAGAGPDLDTLADVRRRSPATFVIGAGGIRNPRDVEAASEAGAGAWLVASALHDGGLPRVRG